MCLRNSKTKTSRHFMSTNKLFIQVLGGYLGFFQVNLEAVKEDI